MHHDETPATSNSKRKATNLTVRTDLLRDAKAFRVNASRAAEAGIEAAVRLAKTEAWLRDNKSAIEAHSERVTRRGTLITPPWLEG